MALAELLLVICLLACPATAQEPEPMTVENKGGGVQYTRPDNTPIYINPNAVAYVRESLEGEPGNATIVFSNGAKQAVKETVEEVIHGIHIRKPSDGDPP